MFKSLKKVISVMLSLLLMLSVMPTGVLAEDANNTLYEIYGNKSGYSEGNSKCEYNIKKLFGKLDDDPAYKVYTIEGKNHIISGSDNFNLHGYFKDNTDDYDFSLSFSFALTSKDDVVSTYFTFHNTVELSKDKTGNFGDAVLIKINSNGIKFAGEEINYSFELNKWYNIDIVIDTENTQTNIKSDATPSSKYIHKIYVNGTNIDGGTVESSLKIYRPYRFRLGNGSNTNQGIYYDNIVLKTISNAATYTPSSVAVTLNESSDEISIENNSITVPKNMTVGQLKGLVAPSVDGARVSYYNSDYSSELSNSDKAIGANIVVTGDEKAFNYYTAQKDVYMYDLTYDGTDNNFTNTSSNAGIFSIKDGTKGNPPYSLISTINGNYGKTSDDKNYLLTDASGGAYRQLNNGLHSKSNLREVMELSILLPNGSSGGELEFQDNEQTGHSFYINSAGELSCEHGDKPIMNLENNRWYNLALVSHEATAFSDGVPTEWDGSYILYVNGEKKFDFSVNKSIYGISRMRLRGTNPENDTRPTLYLDNIRYTNESYNPNYDKEAVVTGKGVDGKKISVVNGTTIAQMKEAIKLADDTVTRVYDANFNEITSDEQPLLDTYTVVFAAKNDTNMERCYSYYDVEYTNTLIDVSILNNGELAGDSYDADDILTVNVSFKNEDNKAHNIQLYVAQYKNKELIKLWSPDSIRVDMSAEGSLSADLSEMTDREDSQIKVILLNTDTLAPYVISKTLNCNIDAE